MRHNSRWIAVTISFFVSLVGTFPQFWLPWKFIYGEILAIPSHNFKQHVKIRHRYKVIILWNPLYLAPARVLRLTSSIFFHNISPILNSLPLSDFDEMIDAYYFHDSLLYISVRNWSLPLILTWVPRSSIFFPNFQHLTIVGFWLNLWGLLLVTFSIIYYTFLSEISRPHSFWLEY